MLRQCVRQFGQKLVHRRGEDTIKESDGFVVHLNAIELVFLGVARNLGAGLYIVVGAVAKYVAGPAIVVCFLVAGLSSLLSRLCCVEFDARVPRSSSPYVCSYVTMGQLWAFVVGWNIIVLFLSATACTAMAWRYAFDNLIGDRISQALEGTVSLHVPYLLATYADFFTLGLVLLLAAIMALLFEFSDIANLMVVVSLLAYSMVCFSVLILRMLCQNVHKFGQKLVRRRLLEPREGFERPEAGPLNTLNLVALGVGSTLGAGVYIVVGEVTVYDAGPATVICFFAAGVSTLLSGLCYAELVAWVPRPGSAYLYSYVTVGELCAFIIGWNLILSFVMATACEARAWSYTFDSLFGNHISRAFQETFSLNVPHFLATYVDFFAFVLVLLLTGETEDAASVCSRMLRQCVRQFAQKLVRRRPLEPQEESESRRAPLSTLSLVLWGVRRTLGAGVYVLAGVMVMFITGPAIIISFSVVALSSVLSGLCYAELWAWVPRSGSACLYSYVTMGELCAFVIGWNLLLYLVPGFTASLLSILDLVKLMSAGVLPDYTLVAVSILVLRYQQDQNLNKNEKIKEEIEISDHEPSPSEPVPETGTSSILKTLWYPTSRIPTWKSGQIVYGCAFLLGQRQREGKGKPPGLPTPPPTLTAVRALPASPALRYLLAPPRPGPPAAKGRPSRALAAASDDGAREHPPPERPLIWRLRWSAGSEPTGDTVLPHQDARDPRGPHA
uniref:Uncharacterized protein n=1 Tax=Rangifer tarandus platyrhynchus TaxID=3082113 RepID=A0ACB0EBQ4_RANTA|nr:unnamed protein product [Rangifer tarandus platyrhynchus]